MSHSPQSTKTRRGVEDYSDGWGAILDLARGGKSWSGRERNCAFLNRGGVSFANVSACSGLDFADDGRAMATTDWDHDGDLDLWLRNRTGPRLRLMLNQIRAKGRGQESAEPAFVALRLVGTDCNRDAIGARVELHLSGENKKLVQTLRAGDAFLSQSSKWIHFGLGGGLASGAGTQQIAALDVRWPSGPTETFSGVRPGGHYVLEQGLGKATVWKRPHADRPLKLAASVQPPMKTTEVAHVLLPTRVPVPVLRYTTFDGAERQLESRREPMLISLWASWCAPCLAELKAFTEHATELRSAGLQILVLSVDGLDREHGTGPVDARRVVERLKFPFEAATATRELVDKLDLTLRYLFDHHPPFVVPISVLLDRQGYLAAVYRGPVEPQRLLSDLQHLDASPERLRQLAVPMSGERHRPPALLGPPRFKALALHFKDRYPEDHTRFLELALRHNADATQLTAAQEKRRADDLAETHYSLGEALHAEKRLEEAIAHYRLAVEAKPDYTDGYNNLGVALAALGDTDEAIERYEQALRIDPQYAAAHYNLANALKATGKLDDAVRHYERALEIDPYDPLTHNNLALALRSQGKLGDSIDQFLQALKIDPDDGLAHYNVGTCYKTQGRWDDAIRHFRRSLELLPDRPDTLNNLGRALMARGDVVEATEYYRRALRVGPELARSHYNLANTLRSQGKLDEAMPYYRKAVKLAPRELLVHRALAVALGEKGDVEGARTHYQTAIQLASAAGNQDMVQSIRKQLAELPRDGK